MRKPLMAANWKMFKTMEQAKEFAIAFKDNYVESDVEVCICAPYLQLSTLKDALKQTNVKIGAQNMHFEEEGAFTGEISAGMLKEIGVDYCIIGHSERRQYFAETDETVNKKIKKALEYDLMPIVCVGESLEQREAGKAFEIVKNQIIKAFDGIASDQMMKMVVAYEPIWAIGTGKTATSAQANEIIGFIRDVITQCFDEDVAQEVRIQYGGSVKPGNATEIMNEEEIDGALVGGASLKPADFTEIINF